MKRRSGGFDLVEVSYAVGAVGRTATPWLPVLRSQRGLSLIELMVASVMFATVALAIGGSTLAAARQNRVSEAHATAAGIAQDFLECMRLERVQGGTINGTCATTVPPGYAVTPNVTTVSPPGIQLQVTVTWTTAPGGSITVVSQAM